MSVKKLGEGKSLQVKTSKGLDIRLFGDSLEVELERMSIGVNIELVNARDVSRALAPLGAYFVIHFYNPGTTTRANEKINEVKNMLPGAIYLSNEGAIIRGCESNPCGTKQAVLNYRDI